MSDYENVLDWSVHKKEYWHRRETGRGRGGPPALSSPGFESLSWTTISEYAISDRSDTLGDPIYPFSTEAHGFHYSYQKIPANSIICFVHI